MLVFFPNAFIYAALTGRNIVIGEDSALAEVCTIINCGYARVGTMEKSFPSLVSPKKLQSGRHIKVYEMGEHMKGDLEVWEDIVHVSGFLPHLSTWYRSLDSHTLEAERCLARVTGCKGGGNDTSCVVRFALQSLIKGPFTTGFTEQEERRIRGVPPHMMHALLTLPHSYAPRFDVGLQLRLQFKGFEKGLSVNHSDHRAEVDAWLAAPLAEEVFSAFESELLRRLEQSQRPEIIAPDSEEEAAKPRDLKAEPYLVFVAADNQDVKEALVVRLQSPQSPVSRLPPQHLLLMYTDSREIVHIKNLGGSRHPTSEGLLDLTFDWYALSLCNIILNYRGSNLLSTFVQSASWFAGTMEATDIKGPVGHGIGSRAFTYDKDQRNKWKEFWFFS